MEGKLYRLNVLATPFPWARFLGVTGTESFETGSNFLEDLGDIACKYWVKKDRKWLNEDWFRGS